jgi:hypothetical protein
LRQRKEGPFLKALKERGFNVGLALKKGWPAIKNNARALSEAAGLARKGVR